MNQFQATIRDFNPATYTATIEPVGAGVIDTWLDGVAIDASINPAFLTHGNTVTVTVPDPMALCQAVITGIAAPPSQPTFSAGAPGSGAIQRLQMGRGTIATDGAGAGSLAVPYPIAFTANPLVYALTDDQHTLTLSALGTTGFTCYCHAPACRAARFRSTTSIIFRNSSTGLNSTHSVSSSTRTVCPGGR
jgi:hypothetical protein